MFSNLIFGTKAAASRAYLGIRGRLVKSVFRLLRLKMAQSVRLELAGQPEIRICASRRVDLRFFQQIRPRGLQGRIGDGHVADGSYRLYRLFGAGTREILESTDP